jgi:hypothetical protein
LRVSLFRRAVKEGVPVKKTARCAWCLSERSFACSYTSRSLTEGARYIASAPRLTGWGVVQMRCTEVDALALSPSVKHWTLTALRDKLIKVGCKVVHHARRVVFQLAEVSQASVVPPMAMRGPP